MHEIDLIFNCVRGVRVSNWRNSYRLWLGVAMIYYIGLDHSDKHEGRVLQLPDKCCPVELLFNPSFESVVEELYDGN